MEDIPEQEGRSWFDFLITRVTALLDAEEYDQALTQVDMGLSVWKGNLYLLFLKSIVLSYLKRPDEALRQLYQIYRENPFEEKFRDELGRNLMLQGYYHSALSVLQHYEFMSNGLAGIRKLFISICHIFTGNPDLAIEYCDGIQSQLGDTPDVTGFMATIHALKALALIHTGEMSAAAEIMAAVGEEGDKMPLVPYVKGILAWRSGDISAAETFLRASCEDQPQDMQSKVDLAHLLTECGREDEALVIRRDISGFYAPPHPEAAPVFRAEELLKSGRYEEAEVFLESAQKSSPDDMDLFIAYLSSLYFTGRYDDLIRLAETGEKAIDAWKAIYLKASARYSSGRIREAIRDLITAAARDRTNMMFSLLHMKSAGYFKPPSEETPESLALELFMTDGMDAAIPPFEVLAHASGAPEYQAFLCFCYILANRGTDAVLISEWFADSKEPDFCLIRAIAFRSVGCLHDAEGITRDVLTNYPDSRPALNMYVRTLLEQDRYRDAYFELSSRKDALSSDCTLLEAFISCLIRSGEYRDAALTAVRIMQMNPGRPMDYYLCALACQLEGSFHTGLYAMRENFRICGSSKKNLLMYGRLLLLATEAQEAAILFSECKNSLPNTAEVRYLHTAARILSGSDKECESVSEYAARFFQAEKGELRAFIGDYRQAARMLAEEIRQDPDDSSLRITFARVLFELEQYGEALSQLSLASGRYGYDGEVKDLLEEGLKMLRLQGPLEDLKTISHTPERYAELLHERAVSLKRYGVVRLAVNVCTTLTNIESDSPIVSRYQADAYHMLGDLEENEERYVQAIAVYDQLLQNDPDNPVFLAEKGLVLDNLRRFDEAEPVLLRALELDPSSGVAHSALCWCLSNLGRHEEAVVHGNQAVILMPYEWGAWNNRGLSRLGLRDFEGAVSDFRQAIRCQPGEVIARRNLCDALAALDDDDAHEEYEQIIVRFGKRAFPEEEEEVPAEPRVPGRPLKTPVGYMDGYW